VKNRKPYWYSITTQPTALPRIVVPEHFDRRYPATLLTAKRPEVVLDKLFVVTPHDPNFAELLLASLNSLLVTSQVELRGRTNLGEGVLEMKRADWDNVLVPSPEALDRQSRQLLKEAFAPARARETTLISEELGDSDRMSFDLALLDLLGLHDPETARISLERDLRAAVSERRERAASVGDAKASKATVARVATNVDAYATRIAATLEAYPDPRAYVPAGCEERLILVGGAIDGELTIGEDLLSQGMVFAGGQAVAEAGDLESAQFVQAVLRHDPDLSAVPVPAVPSALDQVIGAWREASQEWLERFDRQVEKVAGALVDPRAKAGVRERALSLLHGS
jgi:hypothetical protein